MSEIDKTVSMYTPLDDNGEPYGEGGRMYLSRLGGGGFGETYRAYFSADSWRSNGTPDGVVKVFTYGNDPDIQKLCRDSEFHRLENARLNAKELRDLSPRPCSCGIAHIHPNNYPAFLMSYIEGVSFEDILRDMARGNTPSARERLAYATALAEPLRALHSARTRARDGAPTDRYMHGDVKPNNLVIQYEPLDGLGVTGEQGSKEVFPRGLRLDDERQKFQIKRCRLLDFGTLREDADIAYPELTPAYELDLRQIGLYAVYAAPERLNKNEIQLPTGERVVIPGCLSVTSKSDVWSYGILLLRMCYPDLYASHHEKTDSRSRPLMIDGLSTVQKAIEDSARTTREQLEVECRTISQSQHPDKRYLDVIDHLLANVILRCLEPASSDRPSMAQITSLLESAWKLLRTGEFGALKECDLSGIIDENLGLRKIDRNPTPTFVDSAASQAQDAATSDAWDPRSRKDLNYSENATGSPAIKEHVAILGDDCDDGLQSGKQRHVLAFSVLACVTSLAAPLLLWSILLEDGIVYVDLVPLVLGSAAVLIGAIASVLSRGIAAVSAVASLALATAVCLLFPNAAMMLPAALGASNAQYHIAEHLDAEGNTDAAFVYYEQSANADNPFSLYALGEYYEYGSGPVEQNSEMADAYYERATSLGYPPA